jgi:hypothetical protein
MSKPKFTPGPYRISPFEIQAGGFDRIIMADDGFLIATCEGRSVEENHANATLFSAAPDLHESVRKAIQLSSIACDWDLDEVEIDGEMVSTFDLGREFKAALAKAVKK